MNLTDERGTKSEAPSLLHASSPSQEAPWSVVRGTKSGSPPLELKPSMTAYSRTFLVVSMLLTGTINTVATKCLYQLGFTFPWSLVLVMFSAEAACL